MPEITIPSASIVNLRKARKSKAKAASVQKADENRIKYGEKSAARKARNAEEERKNKVLEAGRIEHQQNNIFIKNIVAKNIVE